MAEPFMFHGDWTGPVVAAAVHAGHELRPEVARLLVLPEAQRLREEDPHTGRLAAALPDRVVAQRSRFEVDLNRPRDRAVYRSPEESWGLDVWHHRVPEAVVEESQRIHDAFHAALASRLDGLAARGPFVVYDIHSYNHRRDAAGSAAPDPAGDPEVNVGTGSLDRTRWWRVVDAFTQALVAAPVPWGELDVRENIRFRGGHLSAWIHARYPETGCCLALEFRKSFMDEWTGEVDERRLAGLVGALATTVPVVEGALAGGSR